MTDDIKYYLKVRIPGIDNKWMSSEPLSLKDAYYGLLSLRDYELTGENVKITQRKGRDCRKISFSKLSEIFASSRLDN